MPISPPRLDDRAFEDLVAELLARIPAHTPEWTDPRVGDPGRALIELFAWLGDTLLYRANLIPERQRLVFLKLLGDQQRPAIPAKGLVALEQASATTTSPVTFRSGARVNGPPAFETQSEVTILPVTGRIYAKRLLSEAESKDMTGVVNDLMDLYRALRPELATGSNAAVGYVTHEVFPGSAPSPQGYDMITETADHALWIALLAASETLVGPVRSELTSGSGGQPYAINLGFVPSTALVGALDEIPLNVPRRMVVEVLTAERSGDQFVFSELDVVADSTRGLTIDGVLRVSLAVGSFGMPSNDVVDSPQAGMGELPPRIDNDSDARRLVGWLRLRPSEPLASLPVTWLGINAVEVVNQRTFSNVVLGISDGRSDQVFSLPATSVEPASLALEVLEDDAGYVRWQRVDDLLAARRDDRAYLLDAEAGTVRFGDGMRGYLPPIGARVRVLSMKAGGGSGGNLPPRKLTTVQGENPDGEIITGAIAVTQTLATRGGVDAESLAVAERRIPATLRHRDRAVTESDFRALAAATPGLRVGRVEVLPRFKPQQRRSGIAGVVSVMGIPASGNVGFRSPAPRPDRHFIETMYAWLDERRLLGTELYVIGPEYVPLSATVGVDIRPGFGVEETLSAVRLALRVFFWPLAPGGPASRGWGLGSPLVAAQAEIAVARVPGVGALRGLRLFSRGRGEWIELPAVSGNQLALDAWQLPELLHVVAVSGQDAPGTIAEAPNPFTDGVEAIPIPIVPKVC